MDLLNLLLKGNEKFKKLLIEDSENESGLALLKSFTAYLADRYDVVHLVLFTVPENIFVKGFSEDVKQKLRIHSAVNNILGWNEDSPTDFTLDSNLLDIVNLSKDRKQALVIDDLSLFITRYSCCKACQLLHQLSLTSNLDNEQMPIIALVHIDLCNDFDIKLLHYAVDTVVKVEPSSNIKFQYLCRITHRKISGKIIDLDELFSFNSEYILMHSNIVQKSSKETDNNNLNDTTMSNLTFKLSLKKEEKEAREQLHLPYMHHHKSSNIGGGGNIFYEADDVDDIDEDDPDDDLCV